MTTTQYLVDFVDTATDAEIATYFDTNNCTTVKVYDNLNKVYLVSASSLPPAASIVSSVIDDSATILQLLSTTVTPLIIDYPITTISTTDQKQWWKVYSLGDVNVSDATLTIPVKGQHSTVYVVDSGIDRSHDEFVGTDVELLWSMTGEYSDTSGHGTALASVIVGKTCSLNQSKLKVVKIFDATVQTKQSDLLSAFDAIIADYNIRPAQSAIVNLSWSIPKNQYIEDKISYLIDAGLIVVVAAGNNGAPIDNVTPASMPAVLTIGAYNVNFTPCNFSNYTDPLIISLTNGPVNEGVLDGWAPGENIWVAKPGGGYGFTAGTSIAAAIQSAAIAYNMVDRITSEFNVVQEFRSTFLDPKATAIRLPYMQTISLTRQGLLNLTSAQYAESVNRVSTFGGINGTKSVAQIVRLTDKDFGFIVGESAARYLVEPALVASVEILDPLPEGVTVELPFISGRPTIAPVGGRADYIIRARITPKDASHAPVNVVWTIKIVTNEYATTLPPTDSIIKVKLLHLSCSTTSCTSCTQPAGGFVGCMTPQGGKNCFCS